MSPTKLRFIPGKGGGKDEHRWVFNVIPTVVFRTPLAVAPDDEPRQIDATQPGSLEPQAARPPTELQSTSTKGSLGRAFAVVICTEDFDRPGFCLYVLHEISVHDEPDLGCLRYSLTDVPPQSNSRSGSVRRVEDRPMLHTQACDSPRTRPACALSSFVCSFDVSREVRSE